MSDKFFIIISGPNGAGKSTISKEILKPYQIKSFDWDVQFYNNWRKFDFDPVIVDGIINKTNVDFEDHL